MGLTPKQLLIVMLIMIGAKSCENLGPMKEGDLLPGEYRFAPTSVSPPDFWSEVRRAQKVSEATFSQGMALVDQANKREEHKTRGENTY